MNNRPTDYQILRHGFFGMCADWFYTTRANYYRTPIGLRDVPCYNTLEEAEKALSEMNYPEDYEIIHKEWEEE